MTTLKELSTTHKIIAAAIAIIAPIAATVVLSLRAADTHRMDLLDEKIYDMKGSVITQPQLAQTKSEIVQYIDIRFTSLQSEISVMRQMQEKQLDMQQRDNEATRKDNEATRKLLEELLKKK